MTPKGSQQLGKRYDSKTDEIQRAVTTFPGFGSSPQGPRNFGFDI